MSMRKQLYYIVYLCGLGRKILDSPKVILHMFPFPYVLKHPSMLTSQPACKSEYDTIRRVVS